MQPTRKQKTVRYPSAYPLYIAAAAFLLWALITPIYSLAYILIGLAIAVGAFIAGKRFFPGRTEVTFIDEITGDEELDGQIRFARDLMKRVSDMSAKMPESDEKEALSRIYEATDLIIEDVVRDATDRNNAYTFFSYYLPTLDKLLSFYGANTGAGENATETKKRIANSLTMIAEAFEKQQDKMYKNEAMDVKTDIAVMEAMLRSEGLIDKK